MPGRDIKQDVPSETTCRRCKSEKSVLTVRNDAVCQKCFCKYVGTKVIKRMESFRVRHAAPGVERKLLLPLSFGHCSTTLLYILSEHLRGQMRKTGRMGYHLHVLHIEDGDSDSADRALLWQAVQERFPDHLYTLHSLAEAASLVDSLEAFGPAMQSGGNDTLTAMNKEQFHQFLSNYNPATSRADFIQILRRRLIYDLAKEYKCEAILFGDSTTRLAERTLAETAKGRGFSLPWVVSDGQTPFGIASYYPLRDLLGKEVAAFPALAEPSFADLVSQKIHRPAVSIKNNTIDELVRQYFGSVEQEFPSVVANVVKTAEKLQSPDLADVENQCELCDMPLDGQAPARSRLCYGCIRTLPVAG